MAEPSLPLPQKTLKVSELTRYLKYLIEQDDLLTSLSVRGEVADLSRSPSGHVYFSIKDDSSQVSCVLFRREALQQAAEVQALRKGLSVVVHGFLTIYEPRGSYQVYVERVLAQGEGAAHRRFEELRDRLEKEGLFSAERKRPLPPFPKAIALITSPGSQAYHDVLHRLQEQYPFVRVIVAGASVQGEGAPDEMVMAIDIVNRLTNADLILLVRGGGSPEELTAFNEERLVRSIFASRLPVVTGIGHQTDNTIADFVADVRAATPSLAAAAAVPDVGGLGRAIADAHARMGNLVHRRLREERRHWTNANRALIQARPETRLKLQRRRNEELSRRSRVSVEALLRTKRARLEALRLQLDALDPLSILSRGYAVLTDETTGTVVTSTRQAGTGSRLRARVADGELVVRVESR